MNGTDEHKYQINILGPTSGLTIGDTNQVTSRFGETPTHPTPPEQASPAERVWNIPYPRNLFFTDREDLLSRLQRQLQTGQSSTQSQPQAISGLGGIGKTQIAVEYAYQHHQDYQAVLWARAESRGTLTSSLVDIAALLHLPEKDAQDQTLTVQAVKVWLQSHREWLLVLDNADELAVVQEFLPSVLGGQLLLTTRAQALEGLARRIEVDIFTPEQGALFLLRRASLIAPDASLEQTAPEDHEVAVQINQELGGLPLALDQAGAYIEETGCRLQDYQCIYQQRRTELLEQLRGLVKDHPEPVATTLSLSFARVEEKDPAAAELLRFCAYLSPEDITEEMITQGAPHLGPLLEPVAGDPYELNQAIEVLRAHSLMQRDPSTGALSIHRLVQAVLRDTMPAEVGKLWAERTVRAVNAVFPEVEFAQWAACERCLPHAQTCCGLMAQDQMSLPEVADLLTKMGWYLRERGQYQEAEEPLRQALALREHNLGSEHLDTAQSLSVLGGLYDAQGKYEQAEPSYRRALAIREQQLGPEHPDTASSLNNLAGLYDAQGKYEQAEPLYRRALAIREQQLGLDHPSTASTLNKLAGLYRVQGKYEQAEPLYERALEIDEKTLGSGHPGAATDLNNLALLYHHQGKYEQAEPLYERALAICEKQLGPQHPNTASSLNKLAELYRAQSKYEQAELLYRHALAIYKQQLGPQHPYTASTLNQLAGLYRAQGKYEQAEPLYQRALGICEKQLGPEHPYTATNLNNLAALYDAQGKYEQAEPLYKHALAICEKQLSPEHPYTATSLNQLAGLYRAQGKHEQAEPLYQHALAICEKQLGPEHLGTAQSLNQLAGLYRAQGKYEQAEPLYQRALAICEKQLGPEHSYTRLARGNYISLLRKLGRKREAKRMAKRK